MNLTNLIKSGVVIWDGAMGTLLQERGLLKGRPPEELNLKNPGLVLQIHTDYLEAGAVGVTTNTFGANRVKLGEYGLESRASELNRRGAEIARSACKGMALVSGSVGPTGKFLRPLGELEFKSAVDIFSEQIGGLIEGGADVIKIETMMDIRELKAAIYAARSLSEIPVIAMMTFQDNFRTLLGTTPESFGVVADGMGADVIGINCSVGPGKMMDMLQMIASVTHKPLIGQPNAGIPKLVDGKTLFPMGPDDFSKAVEEFLPLGVRIIAGCCGTTPDHMSNVRARLNFKTERGFETLPAPERAIEVLPGQKVASRTRVVAIDIEGPLMIIGERINPTGKRKLAEELRKGVMEGVIREAREQEANGAHILDVNVGVPGVEEDLLMEEAVYAVNLNSSLPVMVDSANAAVIEKGLMAADGIPVINSVSGEMNKLEDLLPLAKRFGASLVCLLLDESGIPESPRARLAVAMKILKEAERAGISRDKLIIDCLTTAISASHLAAVETLETVKLVRRELNLPVILGVSNVSFGLPGRQMINRAFLSMAVTKGLNLAIMNPHDRDAVDTVSSCNLLSGKDKDGYEYIRRVTAETEGEGGKEFSGGDFPEIREAVRSGRKGEIVEIIEMTLKQGAMPLSINNDGIVRGLEEVGKLFNANRIFLPQVIAAAETAKIGFERIKSEMGGEHQEVIGRVLLATVEGDIHDIGKNIVAALLANHGFEVIDLGKNVPAEKILEEAIRNRVDVVGLSALMTTTMIEMKKVIALLKSRGVESVSIIGGAVVTEDFAKEIGAEFYAEDAMDAVTKLRKAVLDRRR
ncbi:MAG: dihydropteroate synthase [Deltaproteobacteria bacterium]|nr:dihydropteroate synthase [Deltaproteobacteria bacterium]NIS76673.1 dihydropteroate synthase [Deltaproteobacteria bacterium]